MISKLRKWEIDETAQARIMQRLVEDRYVDDERYCRAFVRDKVRFDRWGPRKIEYALRQKQIDSSIYRPVMAEIDDSEYIDALRPLIESKRRSTKASSDYELNGKLIRFAMQRGYTMEIIGQCLDTSSTL